MSWIDDAQVTTAEEKAAQAVEQARTKAKAERDAALAEITYTTAAGDVIQCREQDEVRLRRQLARMEATGETGAPWIAADNTPVTVTPDDLRGALRHGEDEVARIFEAYMEAVL